MAIQFNLALLFTGLPRFTAFARNDKGGLCLNYKTTLACGHPAIEGNFPPNTVIPAQAGIHCVADNYSFTPAGKTHPVTA